MVNAPPILTASVGGTAPLTTIAMIVTYASSLVIRSLETAAIVAEEAKANAPLTWTAPVELTVTVETIAGAVASVRTLAIPSMETVALVMKGEAAMETKVNAPPIWIAKPGLTVNVGTFAMIANTVSSGTMPSMETAVFVGVAPPILTATLARTVEPWTTAMIVTGVSHLAIPSTETVLYARHQLVLLP